jgi:sugar-specific transcriptional regulator TrmB
MEKLENVYITVNFMRYLDVLNQRAKLLFFWIGTQFCKNLTNIEQRKRELKELYSKFLRPNSNYLITTSIQTPEVIEELKTQMNDGSEQELKLFIKMQPEIEKILLPDLEIFLSTSDCRSMFISSL